MIVNVAYMMYKGNNKQGSCNLLHCSKQVSNQGNSAGSPVLTHCRQGSQINRLATDLCVMPYSGIIHGNVALNKCVKRKLK